MPDTDKSSATPVDPVEVAAVEVPASVVAQPADGGEKIPMERLLAEGFAYTGHANFIVAGALSSIDRKSMTIDEAKKAVDKWLKTPLADEGE